MKCDICGKTNFEEGECLFKPDKESKTYCFDCKNKAEQEGTASWLPKNDPGRKTTPSNFPWLWIILIIVAVAGIGLIIYWTFRGGVKICRNCGLPKYSCDCPLLFK